METKPASFKDKEEWKKGHRGELIVSKILQDRGWFIIPSYDYTGEDDNKAPRLQGASASYVVPDLDIGRSGKRLWAEVKTKAAATFTRKLGRYEHGLPIRHFQHYLKVQDITGCEVWLFIFEENTGEIRTASLNSLTLIKREYHGDKMGRDGMVFFARDAMKVVANIHILQAA